MSIKSILLRYAIFFMVAILLLSVAVTLPLRWFNPVTTSFVLRDSSIPSVWISPYWAPLDTISDHVQLAIIASEDQRFPTHFGIDMVELRKALFRSGGPSRGASTLTQQLAKNLYLWPGKGVVSKALRKGVEAYLALWLELFIPKARLLELYLNVIEYGEGVYGITQAGNLFFTKSPSKLNRVDASLLAAVLPNPKKMNVKKPSPYVYERALDIRFAMANLGGTTYIEKIRPEASK